MSSVMLRTEGPLHYKNHHIRQIGFDKAGSRYRRCVQPGKIADVLEGCKSGTLWAQNNATISFAFFALPLKCISFDLGPNI